MMTEIEKHIWSIFDQVLSKDDLDQILYDIEHVSDFLSYKTVNENDADEPDKKQQLILQAVDSVGSKTLKKYFQQLLKEDNLWLFEPTHYKTFIEEFISTTQKAVFFQITVAVKLKDEDIKSLSKNLSDRMQKKVIVDIRMDESLIAGAIIKKDNYILDYSIKTKLSKLADKWKESIQKSLLTNDKH